MSIWPSEVIHGNPDNGLFPIGGSSRCRLEIGGQSTQLPYAERPQKAIE
jgi:hypothetical protein